MLWVDFMNSEWHDWRGSGKSEDRLYKPEWLQQWLTEHQLIVQHMPTSAELEALKNLRTQLQRCVRKLVGGAILHNEDINELNQILAQGSVIRHIHVIDGLYRLEVTAAKKDWPHLMAEIIASFARTLAEGEASRIRICDNPDCLWIYYDDTRNRSKRYCDDKMCGNLMKVRRFRARKKAAAEEST